MCSNNKNCNKRLVGYVEMDLTIRSNLKIVTSDMVKVYGEEWDLSGEVGFIMFK